MVRRVSGVSSWVKLSPTDGVLTCLSEWWAPYLASIMPTDGSILAAVMSTSSVPDCGNRRREDEEDEEEDEEDEEDADDEDEVDDGGGAVLTTRLPVARAASTV